MNSNAANVEPVGCAMRGRVPACMVLAAALALGPQAIANPAPEVPGLAQVRQAVDDGHFKAATALIERALQADRLDARQRADYAFERERMRRIRMDFSLDEATVRTRVRQQISGLDAAQFDARFNTWNRAGMFERMQIDGQARYFNRAPSNLFRLDKHALALRDKTLPPLLDGPLERLHPVQQAIRTAALDSDRHSVMPLRLRMTQTVTVKADAVPAGKPVRAWIPYPRAIPGQQDDIRLVGTTPGGHQLAPESALQRTVALQATAHAGQPTVFAVTYELTLSGQYHALDPARVTPTPTTAALAPYVQERPPHVVFTPAMRAYSRKVVGGETNPYAIARKLFAAVDTIPWAGAREYSTIGNISDYALHAGHADCGQQTLLLITLLRMNGIPARWQSGMVFAPDGDYSNIHDWGQVYLAPYGWVPMDVTTGRLAADKGTGNDPALEWFYLGGLDNWRIAFNDDWAQPLVPAKQFFRSDTVDSQRGEVEWAGGNLYYDQWSYRFQWQRLPLDAVQTGRGTAANDNTSKR